MCGVGDVLASSGKHLHGSGLTSTRLHQARPWSGASLVITRAGACASCMRMAGVDVTLEDADYYNRLPRYIRNHDAPEAWSYVWRHSRALAHHYWPWLRLKSH